jgi:hypothetical protein
MDAMKSRISFRGRPLIERNWLKTYSVDPRIYSVRKKAYLLDPWIYPTADSAPSHAGTPTPSPRSPAKASPSTVQELPPAPQHVRKPDPRSRASTPHRSTSPPARGNFLRPAATAYENGHPQMNVGRTLQSDRCSRGRIVSGRVPTAASSLRYGRDGLMRLQTVQRRLDLPPIPVDAGQAYVAAPLESSRGLSGDWTLRRRDSGSRR